jgi:hypothetical protein
LVTGLSSRRAYLGTDRPDEKQPLRSAFFVSFVCFVVISLP